MKKLLFVLLLFSAHVFGQSDLGDTSIKYIELVASVDWYGDARIYKANYPKDKVGHADTLIKRKRIDDLIKSHYEGKKLPIELINDLADEGWVLVSTTFVPGPDRHEQGVFAEKGRVVYYLKKRFLKQVF